MDLEKVKGRFKRLTNREKIIFLTTIVLSVIIVPYMFLYGPSAKKVDSLKIELNSLKSEIKALDAAIVSISVRQPVIEGPIELPDTEDLAGMLAAITREANRADVEFISLVPESIKNKNSYVQMKIKIELRVRFKALYDFLRNIEERQRLFMIKDVKFETNDTVYPSGIALVKAVVYLRKG